MVVRNLRYFARDRTYIYATRLYIVHYTVYTTVVYCVVCCVFACSVNSGYHTHYTRNPILTLTPKSQQEKLKLKHSEKLQDLENELNMVHHREKNKQLREQGKL